MRDLNKQLENARQSNEGFHPSLFDIDFNFSGINDLPKIMKKLVSEIFMTPKFDSDMIDFGENKIDIKFSIDTTSDDFKELLKYLFNLKSEEEQKVLGSITIYYYSKDGTIFFKRKLKEVKFNKDENKFDIFDCLRFDAEPIHEIETNFTFEKIEYSI